MIKTLLHFDSIDGNEIYDTILKTTHCYNTTIKINNPLSHVKEISLKSLEMPYFLIILEIVTVQHYYQINLVKPQIMIYQ